MRYFISQSHPRQLKNKAQEYIQNFVKKFELTLIDSDESLDCLCNQINNGIQHANKTFTRCRDLKLSVDNQLETNNGICVIIYDDIHTITHFTIYPVLKSYHEGGLTYELFTN